MDGAKFFGAAKGGDGQWKRLQFLRKGWLWILGTHVSQVESENKHMRPRRAEGALHINDNGLTAQSNLTKEGLRPAQGK